MGPRATLTVAALSALLGAGCSSAAGTEGDFGADGGASDMGTGCGQLFVRVMPSDATAPATLEATGDRGGFSGPISWRVLRAGDATPLTPRELDASQLRVEYDATLPGTYTFELRVGACTGRASVDVRNPSGATVVYRVRVSPPDTAGVPTQDKLVAVVGGTPLAAVRLQLDPGVRWSAQLRNSTAPIAGQVRLIAQSGSDGLGAASDNGQLQISVGADRTYRPLVIPAAPDLAPFLFPATVGALLPATLVVSSGATVSGHVRAPGSAAIPGARVVLRRDVLPSGVGTSAIDGSYALHVDPGTGNRVEIGAPEWPTLTLTNVDVAGDTTIDVDYTAVRRGVSWVVHGSDGQPAPGARVTLRSAPLIAANLSIGGGAAQAVSGRVERIVVAGALGALPPLDLPDVDYDVVLEPASGNVGGVTIRHLAAGTPAMQTLMLAAQRTLSGRVTDVESHAVSGARVVAVHATGLGAAPQTVTGADGTYSLTVDAVDLAVHVLPPPAAHLADRKQSTSAGDTTADVSLEGGLSVEGLVIAPGGAPIAGVLVEVICATCSDPTPVTTTISDASGAFLFYVADPGDIPDGGT